MSGDHWDELVNPPKQPLLMEPKPPSKSPSPGLILLGRFQPFHRGHASLVSAAISYAETNELNCRIVIGSANLPESLDNPWTWQEREEMIRLWLDSEHPKTDIEIVSIPDINDPPNWVTHAEQYHGKAGILFTSDAPTDELYKTAGWKVVGSPLESRESWQGWRIRSTLKMLSTVNEREAAISVMAETIPNSIAEHLWDESLLKRLAFLGRPFEPVG